MARYNGDGSYQKLLEKTYGKNITGTFVNLQADNGIKFNPLFFLSAGYNNHNSGSYTGKGSSGIYWESQIKNAMASYYLGYDSAIFGSKENNRKGFGVSLRCVANVAKINII